MNFGAFVLLAFGTLFIAFLWAMWRNAKEAGSDSLAAKQGEQAGKARRDAQEAESRVDGMSDNDVRDRLRDTSQR